MDDFDPIARVTKPLEISSISADANRRGVMAGAGKRKRDAYAREVPEDRSTRFYSDTDLLINDTGVSKPFMDFTPGDLVYDPACEVSADGTIAVGDPSAKVVMSHDCNLMFYCFNCQQSSFCVPSWHADYLEYQHTDVVTVEDGRINNRGRVDIDIGHGDDDAPRMHVVDAPMGSGKTELLVSLANKYPRSRILCISFRSALAIALASRIDLQNYKDDDAFLGHNLDRISICLDSIVRIPDADEKYDFVFLDEAGYVRMHCAGDTIRPRCHAVLAKTRSILAQAGTVVLLQYRMLESDVIFWGDLAGVNHADRKVCKRWVLPTASQPSVMWYTDALTEIILEMRRFYLESWNQTTKRMERPFIVFCARATHCRIFMRLLQRSTTDLEGASDRIRGVWADVQDEEWPRKFLGDPVKYSPDCDVLFVSPVVQAGHDFHYFVTSFSILPVSNLTHRDEIQLIGRLRDHSTREVVTYAYIENGIEGRYISEAARIRKNEEALLRASGTGVQPSSLPDPLIVEARTSLRAERAHTRNKHAFLWRDDYDNEMDRGRLWRFSVLRESQKLPQVTGEDIADIRTEMNEIIRAWDRGQANILLRYLPVDDVSDMLGTDEREQSRNAFRRLEEAQAAVSSRKAADLILTRSWPKELILPHVLGEINALGKSDGREIADKSAVTRNFTIAYNLAAYMDFVMYQGGVTQSWDLRLQITPSSTGNRMGHLVLLRCLWTMAKFLHDQLPSAGAFDGIYDGPWPSTKADWSAYPGLLQALTNTAELRAAWETAGSRTTVRVGVDKAGPATVFRLLTGRVGIQSSSNRKWGRGQQQQQRGRTVSRLDEKSLARLMQVVRVCMTDHHIAQYRQAPLPPRWIRLLDQASDAYHALLAASQAAGSAQPPVPPSPSGEGLAGGSLPADATGSAAAESRPGGEGAGDAMTLTLNLADFASDEEDV